MASTDPADFFVRDGELKSRYGIPYTTQHIRRLERDGKFPARSHLGPGCSGHWDSEIRAWLESKKSDAREAA